MFELPLLSKPEPPGIACRERAAWLWADTPELGISWSCDRSTEVASVGNESFQKGKSAFETPNGCRGYSSGAHGVPQSQEQCAALLSGSFKSSMRARAILIHPENTESADLRQDHSRKP